MFLYGRSNDLTSESYIFVRIFKKLNRNSRKCSSSKYDSHTVIQMTDKIVFCTNYMTLFHILLKRREFCVFFFTNQIFTRELTCKSGFSFNNIWTLGFHFIFQNVNGEGAGFIVLQYTVGVDWWAIIKTMMNWHLKQMFLQRINKLYFNEDYFSL